MPFPDVVTLVNAWASHPPLRLMISRFLEYKEDEW